MICKCNFTLLSSKKYNLVRICEDFCEVRGVSKHCDSTCEKLGIGLIFCFNTILEMTVSLSLTPSRMTRHKHFCVALVILQQTGKKTTNRLCLLIFFSLISGLQYL